MRIVIESPRAGATAEDVKRLPSLILRRVRFSGGCWEWLGGKNKPGGYGRISINGRMVLVHRYVYESVIGKIPNGFSVCHSCDNPVCVRPDHLFVGTHKQNMEDKVSKN